ncbi:dihydrofolate reductase family protein [Nesterenkonia natronophila]|nr:dihydrofolate reductase family protein [Nesterenkonia natronophila]
MTTFIYSAAASADGYIAGPGGDMQWLRAFMGGDPDPLLEKMIPQVTALLIGRTTFDGDDPNAGDSKKEGAFEGRWEGPQIVLTHRPAEGAAEGFTFTHSLEEAIETARQAAGTDGMVHVLGADVARQCLEAGVLDEVLLATVPIFLGGGTPALRGAKRSFPLEVVTRSPNGSTCHYRVLR